MSAELPPNLVVVIDALDECDGTSIMDNLILRMLREQLSTLPKQVRKPIMWAVLPTILAVLLELHRHCFVGIPFQVRFVVTSRPERHITASLESRFRPFVIKREDERHVDDLRQLIAHQVCVV